MSDLVGNPEDRFSHDAAHMVFGHLYLLTVVEIYMSALIKACAIIGLLMPYGFAY